MSSSRAAAPAHISARRPNALSHADGLDATDLSLTTFVVVPTIVTMIMLLDALKAFIVASALSASAVSACCVPSALDGAVPVVQGSLASVDGASATSVLFASSAFGAPKVFFLVVVFLL